MAAFMLYTHREHLTNISRSEQTANAEMHLRPPKCSGFKTLEAV